MMSFIIMFSCLYLAYSYIHSPLPFLVHSTFSDPHSFLNQIPFCFHASPSSPSSFSSSSFSPSSSCSSFSSWIQ